MKKSWIIIIVVVIVLIIIFTSFQRPYNKMVTMDENINGMWAQVENVYQRRTDLIPNLVIQ